VNEPLTPAHEPIWERLPAWLRPRSVELPGTGQLRLLESTLLILVAVFLATATIADVIRQRGVNVRLTADVATWRHYTGHDFHNVAVDQLLLGAQSRREVVCGNTRAGAPGETTQVCLAIWGPISDGRRTVHGGWYLPPHTPDVRSARYGCFGTGARGICPS
jgi:hypothetical protein